MINVEDQRGAGEYEADEDGGPLESSRTQNHWMKVYWAGLYPMILDALGRIG